MSIEAMTWALSVPVGGSEKVVLIGLANHAHPDGTNAYPSIQRLAEYAHCDRRTAQRNLRKLVDAGWIVQAGFGPSRKVRYRLRLERRDHEVATRCVYCESPATVKDHVVPRARGGKDANNRVPACVPCNADKSSTEVREWAERVGLDWEVVEARLAAHGVTRLEGGELPPRQIEPLSDTGDRSRVAPTPPEPPMNRPRTVQVVAHAPARDLSPVLACLKAAGFDGLSVEQDYSAISVYLAERQPPDDTDWDWVTQEIRRQSVAGKLTSRRPVSALKFVLNGIGPVPRVGQPSPYLFGEKPLTGHAAVVAERMRIIQGGDAA